MPFPRRPPGSQARTAPPTLRTRAVRRAVASMARGGAARSTRAGLTSRAAVLAIVACAVLVSLAYPLREYFAQRGEIDRLRAQARATEQRVAALRRQQQQWADPGYVKTQARQRLHFVLPGETAYIVLDPNARAGRSPDPLPRVQQDLDARPWYSRLWRTVEAADRTADRVPEATGP